MVFPAPPFGDTKAIVGMLSPIDWPSGGGGYQIAVRYQVEFGRSPDGCPIRDGLPMVTGRLSDTLWNSCRIPKSVWLPLEFRRISDSRQKMALEQGGLTEAAKLKSTLRWEGFAGKGAAALGVATDRKFFKTHPRAFNALSGFMAGQGTPPSFHAVSAREHAGSCKSRQKRRRDC